MSQPEPKPEPEKTKEASSIPNPITIIEETISNLLKSKLACANTANPEERKKCIQQLSTEDLGDLLGIAGDLAKTIAKPTDALWDIMDAAEEELAKKTESAKTTEPPTQPASETKTV